MTGNGRSQIRSNKRPYSRLAQPTGVYAGARLLMDRGEWERLSRHRSCNVNSPVPKKRWLAVSRTLLRHLAGTLQKVVGLEEAGGFISVVGQEMGDEINRIHKNALAASNLSRGRARPPTK
jgi:hypothetical protein